MSRDFLSNFEQPKQTGDTSADDGFSVDLNDVEYQAGEYPLNICFVWPEGNRQFLEYSRLDGGGINAEYTIISLSFGAETVEISGFALVSLFDSFMRHKRKFIYCDDERYNHLAEEGQPVVNKITITQRK